MRVHKCRGMVDLLPDDMVRFRHIEEVFRDSCLKHGYGEIRTPTLEYLHLFTASGTLTPAMLGRVYSFLDWDGWSGERVVLRPDGTIPTVRLFLESVNQEGTTRLFYVANTFTFEETGTERRERWQCGAELIGSNLASADVELVLLASEVLSRLGVGPLVVRLSHGGLIKTLLSELGLEAEKQAEVFDHLLEGDARALGDVGTEDPNLARALRVLMHVKGNSSGYLENVRALLGDALPRFQADLDELTKAVELLAAMGCTFEIDMTSGRGFEYYTGAMFQFCVSGERVGGGGRYDDLIPLVGGPSLPASGFALYMDTLMELVEFEPGNDRSVLIAAHRGGTDEVQTAFEVAADLREAGYAVEMDMGQPSTSSHRWSVSVSKGGALSLTDQATGKTRKASASANLLDLMEGAK